MPSKTLAQTRPTQWSHCRGGGWVGLDPLAHLNDPLALVNVNTLGGRCNPLPLSSYHSLSMNDLLLIITRPPSTTMHCIPCVRSFEHLLVIKINFSAKQYTKIRLFKIKSLKFWRRGHCPLPQRDDRGESPPNSTYSARASIQPPDLLRRSTPYSCFWTIRAFGWPTKKKNILKILQNAQFGVKMQNLNHTDTPR